MMLLIAPAFAQEQAEPLFQCSKITEVVQFLNNHQLKLIFYAEGKHGINMLFMNKERQDWIFAVVPKEDPSLLCSFDHGHTYIMNPLSPMWEIKTLDKSS